MAFLKNPFARLRAETTKIAQRVVTGAADVAKPNSSALPGAAVGANPRHCSGAPDDSFQTYGLLGYTLLGEPFRLS